MLLPLLAHAADEQAPLRVQLRWLHQAQFAGYYLAETRTSQRAAALHFDLVEGGPGIDPLDRLIKGDVDVAIGWLADALETRAKGADIVNVAQVFTRAGMGLACTRAAGVRGAADLPGRSVGVWNIGDEISVQSWLQRSQVTPGSVRFVQQAADGADLISGRVPCATIMLYNEYWSVLKSGFKPADLLVVRFSDEGLGMLEDGLYVRRASLDDPNFRRKLAAFLKASAEGWQQARENPDEALATTLAKSPALDAEGQRRMLGSVLKLIPVDAPFGLLAPGDYERTVDMLTHGAADANALRRAASGGWTHRIWYAAGLDAGERFTEATRHNLVAATGSTWFYLLDLLGTVSFGLAGFMRARQRRYDLWGAFVLTLLPAVGGGTLRDLIIGGDRSPPFIFHDPAYMIAVIGVVIVGAIASPFVSAEFTQSRRFERFLALFDTVGLAAFTVVGAKVALLAGLAWYWVPICAALTCAGGGVLLDVVTGREPRTFLGEPYEDIAVGGSLVLYLLLKLADHYEHSAWIVTASIIITFVAVYAARMMVITLGIRSYRLGDPRRRRRSMARSGG